MTEPTKKQNFLHGAALLALATAVVKIIGALYKIPLQRVIGDDGFGYFSTAYQIYNVLLAISTAGLPIAMSRMVSQASTMGHYREVRQIYKVSRTLFLILGVSGALLMALGCRWLASSVMMQPDAWFAILCLAPCCLLICIMSTYRGFFQGQEDMRPTSVSQVLEAFVKLIVGLAAAFAIKAYTNSIAMAAGGAILGVTFSCLASSVYLRSKLAPAYRAMPGDTGEPVSSFGATTKKLLAIAVPITIGSAGLYLLSVFETKFYMGQLLHGLGLTQETADNMKGVYNFTQTVFNMPCAFIIPITVSVLPAITAHLTRKDDGAVRATEESAARVTGLISLPCAVGLFLLAEPVMGLLGHYSGEKLALATTLMRIQAVTIFLYAVIQYTNAVLQAHDRAVIPVVNMLLFGAAKLVGVYVLVGNPAIGLAGAPIGTLVCYLCIGSMNLLAIAKVVPQKPRMLRNLLRPLLPAAIMGAAVVGTHWALSRFLHSNAILCAVPIAVGGIVYCVAAVLTRTITGEDCRLLPKGDKLARILHL